MATGRKRSFAHDVKGGAGKTTQPSGTPNTGYKSPGTFGRSDQIGRPDQGQDTNYSRNGYAGPSSVGVVESATLTDFPTKIDDEVRDGLISDPADNGACDDLRRKINPVENVPTHSAMSGPKPSATVPGATAPDLPSFTTYPGKDA